MSTFKRKSGKTNVIFNNSLLNIGYRFLIMDNLLLQMATIRVNQLFTIAFHELTHCGLLNVRKTVKELLAMS